MRASNCPRSTRVATSSGISDGVQGDHWWSTDIKRFRSKKQFLAYAGRYARRPPIAQHRFQKVGRREIRFLTKDTRSKRTVETVYTPAAFLSALADHVPDRYKHGVRYFGLLAPRVKGQTHDALFALLGQPRWAKPVRPRWASSLRKSFGVDPIDAEIVRRPSFQKGTSWDLR
jgi:Putative transposase